MQKKKVLIIGATGMLGHMMYRYFEQLGIYELYNSVYRSPLNDKSIVCNVKDQNAVAELFEKIKPDVVINCVGALIQESKNNPTSAIYLNALFPHILKDLCNQNHAKLIHVSTDCVFSGKKGAYSEDDFRDADDVYGRSKALGEIFDAPHCTLRTSIIGPELKKNGTGLFHWFLNQKDSVKGFSNAFWGGVTTLQLAKFTHSILQTDVNGIVHVSNGTPISKYNLLCLFVRAMNKDENKILKEDAYAINKSLKQSSKVNISVPRYEIMVEEMVSEMQKHKESYKHYFNF